MATLRFYNTLTRSVEDFTSQDEKTKQVKLYTCGPTVYGFAHIGNLTSFVYWDILVRVLEANGYNVKWIMNMTDVGHLASDADEGEDKLERAAARDKKTPWEIAEFFADDFLSHVRALNFSEPEKFARASDYIFEGLDLIKKLITRGVIYSTSDGLYFDISKFPRYADFARLDIKGLEAGARIGLNAEKRNSSDFAVWKFIKKDENHAMQWPLPEGIEHDLNIDKSHLLTDENGTIMGYPGWHLECSTIIHSELGEPIDIHCGGIDHIPVHHTNEIAQSETAFGAPLSHFWLHNNFITVGGEKMSKSKGNLLTFYNLREKGFGYMDFRMWVLMGHYQSERNFSYENLEQARTLLNEWRTVAARRWQVSLDANEKSHSVNADTQTSVLSRFNDNLTTSQAVMKIDEIIKHHGFDQAFFEFVDNITGLALLESTPDLPPEAYKLISTRLEARQNKDWAKSDALRNEIVEKYNVVLSDAADQTFWGYA